MDRPKSSLTQQQLLRQRLLPQQVRFVGLLEKSDEEVVDEVTCELEENPALEKVENVDDSPRYAAAPRASSALPDDAMPVQADREQTLREALMSQVSELAISGRQRRIVAYVIDAIDSNGYLTRTLPQLVDDIALADECVPAPSIEELREAHSIVRTLEPAGVGAMDLRDTLLLQLRRLPPERPMRDEAIEVVSHFFDIYSRRNNRKLAEVTGFEPEVLVRVHELIKTLNPKPGSAFAADPTQLLGQSGVTPDFIVETDGERINVFMPSSIPELQIEETFRTDDKMPGAEAFIRDRRAQALTFIDLLKRRRETLMKIVRVIVRIQSAFFLNGDDESRLRPMVLRQISDATGIDFTVVSRAVAGKWLATPLGTYPLKSFFNHRGAENEADASAPEIQAALRELVNNEDSQHPLSDEALAAELSGQGYKVARRTVAKYRSRLSILPARLRRK